MAKFVYWRLCDKYASGRTWKWYNDKPGVTNNNEYKIFCDFIIQCGSLINTRWPGIVVVDKRNQKAMIIDIRVSDKDPEKMEKIQAITRRNFTNEGDEEPLTELEQVNSWWQKFMQDGR